MIASYEQGSWLFYTPKPGWCMFVISETVLKAFDGTNWQVIGGGLLENLDGIGVNSDTASAPFTAKINAALWTALYAGDGGNGSLIQTLNKENATDDCGFVLQDNFATRALLGLFGSDHLRLSVTADGTNFLDGITINNATGIVEQPNLPRFSGTTNFDNFAAADTWLKLRLTRWITTIRAHSIRARTCSRHRLTDYINLRASSVQGRYEQQCQTEHSAGQKRL